MQKTEAAHRWCDLMSHTEHGLWQYLFIQQRALEQALASGIASFAALASALTPATIPVR